MPLSDDILKSALLGTQKYPYQGNEDSTSALLLAVVNQRLRERVGYVAQVDHLPLPTPWASGETTLCSASAAQYLRLILRGIHREVLMEWIIRAAQAKVHLPEDVLPRILLMGQKRVALRPFLVLVLGEKGFQLAQDITNQNWNWALNTPQEDLDELLAIERLAEDDFILVLRNTETLNIEWWQQLEQYKFEWSSALLDAFFQHLDAYKNRKTANRSLNYQFATRIISLAYYFPLEKMETIKTQLQAFNTSFENNGTIWLTQVRYTMELRKSIYQAIHEEYT